MNDAVPIPDEIKLYLENILEETGVMYADSVMKEKMLNALFVRLDRFITTTIINSLPAEKLEQFRKINEASKSSEEIEAFLKINIPRPEETFQEAFSEFRRIYLESITQYKHSVKR